MLVLVRSHGVVVLETNLGSRPSHNEDTKKKGRHTVWEATGMQRRDSTGFRTSRERMDSEYLVERRADVIGQYDAVSTNVARGGEVICRDRVELCF